MDYGPFLKSLFTTDCAGQKRFKRHPSYQAVVTCGPASVYAPQTMTVAKYCATLRHNGVPFVDIIPSVVAADARIGDPLLEPHSLPGLGKFMAQGSLMHILHDAMELESMMGSLDGLTVVEVGPAYGLMFEVLDMRFDIAKYTAVDLEYGCKLFDLCVGARSNCVALPFEYITPDAESPDLFISYYAFTECVPEIQNMYYEKYIQNSARGVIMGQHRPEMLEMIRCAHPDMYVIHNDKRCANNVTGEYALAPGLSWGPLVVWGHGTSTPRYFV